MWSSETSFDRNTYCTVRATCTGCSQNIIRPSISLSPQFPRQQPMWAIATVGPCKYLVRLRLLSVWAQQILLRWSDWPNCTHKEHFMGPRTWIDLTWTYLIIFCPSLKAQLYSDFKRSILNSSTHLGFKLFINLPHCVKNLFLIMSVVTSELEQIWLFIFCFLNFLY